MNRRLIVVFLFALLCIAAIVYFSKSTEENDKFSLLSVVPEQQVVAHLDLVRILEDSKTINRQLKWGISYSFYLSQFEKQILNSGLELESTYFTHSDNLNISALYLAIKDQEKCDKFAKEIFESYDLVLVDTVSQLYITKNQKTAIDFNEKYVVLSWGNLKQLDKALSTKNPFRDSLLSEKNKLYVNPQGNDTICKDEFFEISYVLDSSLNIEGSWYVESGSPFMRVQDSTSFYPSVEKKWFIALNMSPKQLEAYQNIWLQEKFNHLTKSLNFDYKAFKKYWNGTLSLQFGGETVIEKVTTKTVFDENFNQIEEREVTENSIIDFGLVMGSSEPQEMLSFIKKQSNVNVKGPEIYLPFSPPMKYSDLEEALILSSGNKKLLKRSSDEIVRVEGGFLNFCIEFHGLNKNPKKFDFHMKIKKD